MLLILKSKQLNKILSIINIKFKSMSKEITYSRVIISDSLNHFNNLQNDFLIYFRSICLSINELNVSDELQDNKP